MKGPLTNRSVAILETRQLEDLTALLEKEGATPLCYPMVAIQDNPDQSSVREWLAALIGGRFTLLIFMTGEGIRRLRAAAQRQDAEKSYVDALAKSTTVTRGPKPVRALKELGLAPSIIAPAPTSDGVISALQDLPLDGVGVGVQLFDDANPELLDFLTSKNATVFPVYPYVYGPAIEDREVLELIERIADGEVEVVTCTSSPQITRLFAVARAHGTEDRLRAGLQKTCVAAVGPVAARTFEEHGVSVDVCPERGGFVMKKLVQYLKRHFEQPGA